MGEAIEVDHSHPATFATTSAPPSDLPYPARPWNNLASIRASGDESDKSDSIFIAPAVVREANERGGFYDREHLRKYTALPYLSQAAPTAFVPRPISRSCSIRHCTLPAPDLGMLSANSMIR